MLNRRRFAIFWCTVLALVYDLEVHSPYMIRPFFRLFSWATFFVVCLVLAACSNPVVKKPLPQRDNSHAVDMSGSWEMDYSLSDNTQAKLDTLVRELNRQAERRAAAQGGMHQGPVGGMVIGGGNSGSSVIGLARMADLVTQSPLLEIDQTTHKIRVKREDDFSLVCEFYPGELRKIETPFGTEMCGWNGHQLVFKLALPGGLSIQHVMTLGAAGEKLVVATTVVSSQVSYPFSLNRVYNRFEPGESGFHCEMTLTRGRVCTTEAR